mmetsp:Transcript_19445/g.45205  ORF Transcript_19445/g.45205 Transcript_19445/m.45205 type:complete len:198 (+) Transcript_19445:102-695(+)
MGNSLTAALPSWQSIPGIAPTEVRVLMVGLDNAGKTTIIYRLKYNEVVTTMPTMGFNIEEIKFKDLTVMVWDTGGQDAIRPLWQHFYEGTQGIIFVVDSSDQARLPTARKVLQKLLTEVDLRGAALLVLANKQDMQNALSPKEVASRLSLNELQGREWTIQPACATSGEGLHTGLEWITRAMVYQEASSLLWCAKCH